MKFNFELEHLCPKLPYHNLEHTKSFDWETCPSEEAYWAGVWHDFIYDPPKSDNEERSAEEMEIFFDEHPNHKWFRNFSRERVRYLMLSTKNHINSIDINDKDMVWLHKNDLACFRHGADINQNEKNIFREYQFVPLETYKRERMKIINMYRKHPLVSEDKIDSILEYLHIWQPKFGIFCGSFDPFHRGHFDILQQAEKTFDKVIVAQGQNEGKAPAAHFNLKDVEALKYHEKEMYLDSLIDYLNRKQKELNNVSLVRGLRNAHDLHAESSLFNFIKDYTDVPFTYFISKSENVHISSSAINKLTNLGKEVSQYLP